MSNTVPGYYNGNLIDASGQKNMSIEKCREMAQAGGYKVFGHRNEKHPLFFV